MPRKQSVRREYWVRGSYNGRHNTKRFESLAEALSFCSNCHHEGTIFGPDGIEGDYTVQYGWRTIAQINRYR